VPLVPTIFFWATPSMLGLSAVGPSALLAVDTARDCFTDDYGSLERGFLTSVFALIVGWSVSFTWIKMQTWVCPVDRRLASVVRRDMTSVLGGACAVERSGSFLPSHQPLELMHQQDLLMGLRRTRNPPMDKKSLIPKGYLTTRIIHALRETVLGLRGEPAGRFATIKHARQRRIARCRQPAHPPGARHGQPARWHALFDAGAGKSDADVRGPDGSG